jgi:hypothetical protein
MMMQHDGVGGKLAQHFKSKLARKSMLKSTKLEFGAVRKDSVGLDMMAKLRRQIESQKKDGTSSQDSNEPKTATLRAPSKVLEGHQGAQQP